MSSIIELSGSVLGHVATNADSTTCEFAPAMLLKSEGDAGVDPSTRWSQAARLVFAAAQSLGEWPALPARIQAGRIALNNMSYVDMLPVPLYSQGAIRLHLQFVGGAQIELVAEEARLELDGHGRYLEHLS